MAAAVYQRQLYGAYMSWTYRVMRHPDGLLRIHEHYSLSTGAAWSDAVYPVGESEDELRTDLERMLAALDKAALDYHE